MNFKRLFLFIAIGLSIFSFAQLKVFAVPYEVSIATFTGDFKEGGDYETSERLLGNASNFALGFLQGNLVRIFISSGTSGMAYDPLKSTPTTAGFVGIWTDGIGQIPQHHLDVWGRFRSTGTTLLANSNGNVSIGGSTTSMKLEVHGTIRSTSIICFGSIISTTGFSGDGSLITNIATGAVQGFILFSSTGQGIGHGYSLNSSTAQGISKGYELNSSTMQGQIKGYELHSSTAQSNDVVALASLSTNSTILNIALTSISTTQYNINVALQSISTCANASTFSSFLSSVPTVLKAATDTAKIITDISIATNIVNAQGQIDGLTTFVSTATKNFAALLAHSSSATVRLNAVQTDTTTLKNILNEVSAATTTLGQGGSGGGVLAIFNENNSYLGKISSLTVMGTGVTTTFENGMATITISGGGGGAVENSTVPITFHCSGDVFQATTSLCAVPGACDSVPQQSTFNVCAMQAYMNNASKIGSTWMRLAYSTPSALPETFTYISPVLEVSTGRTSGIYTTTGIVLNSNWNYSVHVTSCNLQGGEFGMKLYKWSAPAKW